MPQEVGQFERRHTAFPRDQHGRKWEAQYDIFAKAPCSALLPSGWSAPWVPSDKYLVMDPKDDRALVIDYDACIRDHQTAAREYQRALLAEARKHGVNGAQMLEAQTLPDGRKIPHRVILDELGPPPLSDTFARAAKAGNKWVLGLRTSTGGRYGVPPWATPFLHELEDPYTETYDGADAAGALDTFPDVEDDVPAALAATAFPDTIESPADLDAYAALEEQYDPTALGGHRQPVRRKPARA